MVNVNSVIVALSIDTPLSALTHPASQRLDYGGCILRGAQCPDQQVALEQQVVSPGSSRPVGAGHGLVRGWSVRRYCLKIFERPNWVKAGYIPVANKTLREGPQNKRIWALQARFGLTSPFRARMRPALIYTKYTRANSGRCRKIGHLSF